uniref:Serine/threonine-protein phosphatase 2A 55 kDa regulatory subunit B n=1 Tax=Ciona savignyi TaxID=51511 RepID=H2YS84_CIOSA
AADIISTVEFNHDGELLATGDKGGRVVIFQREPSTKASGSRSSEYNVYSTFQSHEPEFDYLKSLEIEEKINKIRWLSQRNQAHFLLSTNDKTVKLWKVSEREKQAVGFNLRDEDGQLHAENLNLCKLHSRLTKCNLDIVDIKPENMENLTEVITAAEYHPRECHTFVYSSSKGTIRLCDMREAAFDVKFSHSGRYMITRDYLSINVWDLNMESKPVESFQVHEYLKSKLCSLYENDCIFDKFECCWNGTDSVAWNHYATNCGTAIIASYLIFLQNLPCNYCLYTNNPHVYPPSAIMTGSYNNFFRVFDCNSKKDVTLEASRENSRQRAQLKSKKVSQGGKRKKDEVSVDSLDFNRKILHTAWHPKDKIIAVAATNNLYIFDSNNPA